MQYIIQIKGINGSYGFFEAEEQAEVDEYYKIFREHKNSAQISVYEKQGMTYNLISGENKRRIGF